MWQWNIMFKERKDTQFSYAKNTVKSRSGFGFRLAVFLCRKQGTRMERYVYIYAYAYAYAYAYMYDLYNIV